MELELETATREVVLDEVTAVAEVVCALEVGVVVELDEAGRVVVELDAAVRLVVVLDDGIAARDVVEGTATVEDEEVMTAPPPL